MNFSIYQGLISGKEKLALVGLGYVGLPLAVEFAKHVGVIGFDINEKRVNEYRNGIDSTNEVGEAIKNTLVDFTSDPTRLKEAKFIIVAVPTPVKEDNSPDLAPVESASHTVGQNLTAGSIVVFESTVYPGVTEDICIPIIEKESGLKCGVDWKIGYSPERVNPGDKEHSLTFIRKVVSGMDEETVTEIQRVYDIAIKAGTFRVSNIKTAEAVKVIENSQRYVNIAFMNEIAIICDKMGIDTSEVIDGMNTKWNSLGFRPGLVGGHCIGVDPYYLADAAENLGYRSRLIHDSRVINNSISGFIVNTAVKKMTEAGIRLETASVVILGATFKENCPDIRNSKVIDIVNQLKVYNIDSIVTDPLADSQTVLEEYDVKLVPFKNVPKADCIIVAVAHDEYRKLSVSQVKDMFKSDVPDSQKVLLDIKSIFCIDELIASGVKFWRL